MSRPVSRFISEALARADPCGRCGAGRSQEVLTRSQTLIQVQGKAW